MKIELDYAESSEILQDSLKRIALQSDWVFWTKSPLNFSVIKLGNCKISAPLNKRGGTHEYNGPPQTGKGMPK